MKKTTTTTTTETITNVKSCYVKLTIKKDITE